jgi:hypothetical protein
VESLNSLHKTIIVPLVALLNLVLVNAFEINLGQEYLDNLTATLVNIISLIAVGWGIYKNHHTPRADEIKADVAHDNDLKEVIKEVANDPVMNVPPSPMGSDLKVEDLIISAPNVTVTGESVEKKDPND